MLAKCLPETTQPPTSSHVVSMILLQLSSPQALYCTFPTLYILKACTQALYILLQAPHNIALKTHVLTRKFETRVLCKLLGGLSTW